MPPQDQADATLGGPVIAIPGVTERRVVVMLGAVRLAALTLTR
jgi:hypothetical protein